MILTMTHRVLCMEFHEDLEDITLDGETLTEHVEVLSGDYDRAIDAMSGYTQHSLDLPNGIYHSIRTDGTVQVWDDYTHCPLWQVYSERKHIWRKDIRDRKQRDRDRLEQYRREKKERQLAKKTRKDAALLLAGHDERGSKAKRR